MRAADSFFRLDDLFGDEFVCCQPP